jgi:hypothetical protein
MRCPSCGRDEGYEYYGPRTFGTGVYAPDGVEEIVTENLWSCRSCGCLLNDDDFPALVDLGDEERKAAA